MKKEIRLLGIDDAAFDKSKDKETLIIGVFFRGGKSIDGVLSEKVSIDGTDATEKIIRMIKKSKFCTQIRAVMLKGIAVGGFNVIDITEISRKTKIPVIVVMRRLPDRERIARILKKLGKKSSIKLMENAGRIYKLDDILIQFKGTTLQKAKEIIKMSLTRGHIPEPIRVAHLIAGGISLGESRGRA